MWSIQGDKSKKRTIIEKNYTFQYPEARIGGFG